MSEEKKKRGRPRSEKAKHAILSCATELLLESGLRDMTVDEISNRTGISKATIYKWWSNKTAVAIDAFLDMMEAEVIIPNTGSILEDFTLQLKSVTRFYLSPRGKVFSQLIAEGQFDPQIAETFRDLFLKKRRKEAYRMWERAVQRGEVRPEINKDIAVDLLYGPMIYRLLTGHAPLDDEAAEEIVEVLLSGIKKK
ncbi:TetR/AcrR family transcriptional regulator [Paenibacillus sp. VMFN-D1]|uniref:TetR/AcrR family transcriptional regulator n=1 Tax=Paenibacillus sp. VMFN-D1 TaxID=2135608 RepID=UPI000E24C4D2|nr:TetR/AcrR family transcriptional regulator [Paenibacillus sp. VMFN-D1]RED37422.1 TetR family transcriptional regulator [Paenibacillus sp. VMFN-D1]